MKNETLIPRKLERGFWIVELPRYASGEPLRLIQESSAIGEHDDAIDNPGSSYLWVGKDHHLDRQEVKELAALLLRWLASGSLEAPK